MSETVVMNDVSVHIRFVNTEVELRTRETPVSYISRETHWLSKSQPCSFSELVARTQGPGAKIGIWKTTSKSKG
jgi:hypothetical protein